jgi:hypothetical protein
MSTVHTTEETKRTRRVRTVFGSHAMLAHAWAQNDLPHGRSSDNRMRFDAGTIYSYGAHFPIARFIDKRTDDGKTIVLFTGAGYSSSTGKHKSLVLSALHGRDDVLVVAVPYLSGAKDSALAIARTRILPKEGEVIGWKKCAGGVLVKISVPQEAQRSHAFGRKCRAEFVDVLSIEGATEATSQHDGLTKYHVGQRVTCHAWETDWTKECAGGIHFFITREEAEDY